MKRERKGERPEEGERGGGRERETKGQEEGRRDVVSYQPDQTGDNQNMHFVNVF